MDHSAKICCMVSSLSAGGAERVMSLLANEWAARGHEVTVVTLAPAASDVYPLDRRVDRVALDVELESRSPTQALVHNVRKIRALKRAMVSIAPDVVISFVDRLNVLTLLASAGLRVPVIVSERTHPAIWKVGRVWSLLRRLVYRFADALVIQSEAMRIWAAAFVPPRRTHVIPNPVGDQFSNVGQGAPTARRPIVLGVGRLSPEKGFDLLIRAFRLVAERHPEWSLVIVGQGPKEVELRDLAAQVLSPHAVFFPGAVKDPARYYRVAGLFVLPSRFEGFPNALLEAMACGCAVVATNSPGGTSEIVRHGFDGVLIPPGDVEALAGEMDRLMTDADERSRLGARAAEVSSRFGVDRIAALWEVVMSEVRR
jgi:glycosyltransferase involved in cell wall biosynthesis